LLERGLSRAARTPLGRESNRQLSPSDPPLAYGGDHASLQLGLTSADYERDDPCHVFAAQPVLSDSNRRWLSGTRGRQDRVEVGIQRDHHAAVSSSLLEDGFVSRARKAMDEV
jgi:hypothetical protein